jgi:uncharacterized protein
MLSTMNSPTDRPRSTPKPGQHVRGPLRRCVGCGTGDVASSELIRLVLGPDAEILVDLASRTHGRGAWVHARVECLEKAAPRGLAKSFRASVTTRPAELATRLNEAAVRRLRGLLVSANRAGCLIAGTDAVGRALDDNSVRCVIVAEDARAAAQAARVVQAGAAGKVVAWGTKEELGDVLGRGPTGVVALTDRGFSEAVTRAVSIARLALEFQRGTED